MPFTNNSTRIRVNQTAIAIVWSLSILCLAINCGNSDGNHTSFTANGGAPNLSGGSALGGVQAMGGSSTVGGSPADTDGGIIGGSGEVCTGPIGIADAADTILVDGSSPGRNFEFIGGLSGGGGTSRLLYDY